MRPKLEPLLTFALTGGSLCTVASSFLPIWTLWSLDPICGTGRRKTLWSVFWNTVIDPPPLNPQFQVTRTGDMNDIVLAGFFFGAGTILGFLTYIFRLYLTRKQ